MADPEWLIQARKAGLVLAENGCRGAEPPKSQVGPRKAKYGNTRCAVDGRVFDSKKEAKRYEVLSALERAGVIRDLVPQQSFTIAVNGVIVCRYVADFAYVDESGRRVAEDVKSAITRRNPVYRLKKKLLKAVYGIEVVEI